MKKVIMLVVMVILAAASAGAEIYTVKKGDCLSKIAVRHHTKWQAIFYSNFYSNSFLKDPDCIYPGQILTVPATEKAQVKYTPLNSLGAHTFGRKRSAVKAIKKFSLPKEVKRILIAKVRKGDFEWSPIKKGDRFSEMVFGNYEIAKKKYANWDASHLEAARLYKTEFQGEVYLLFDPLKCRNLAWRMEKKADAIKFSAEKQKKKLLLMMLIPPASSKYDSAQTTEFFTQERFCYKPDFDISIGAFTDRHRSGNEPRGWWGVGNFYFFNIEEIEKIQSFGIAVEGNRWSGTTGDGYDYFGKRYAVGPAYRLLTPDSEFQFRTGLGEVDDWGHIETSPAGKYESDQNSEIITAYAGYEKKKDGAWLHRVRCSLQADIDYSREKTDRWIDGTGTAWPLSGEASNKTMINAGIDSSVYRLNENFSLAGGLSSVYYQEESKVGVTFSPGLDFFCKNMLVGGVRVYPTYWSDSDHAIGVGAFIDLTNIVRSVWPNFLPSTSVGEKWEEKVPVQSEQEKIITDILK